MTKKEKDLITDQFNKKMAGVVVLVNDAGVSIPIDEYIEQEQYARHTLPPIFGSNKCITTTNYTDGELGILSKNEVLKTDLYLMTIGL